MSTYIAPEPEEKTVFVDNAGRHHETRDAAIEQSFENDFANLWADYWVNDSRTRQVVLSDEAFDLMRKFMKDRPDMFRIALGDRDAT